VLVNKGTDITILHLTPRIYNIRVAVAINSWMILFSALYHNLHRHHHV